ncbi:hypothetical protein CRE_07909 [Caenorhabditis remanei]|uniref:F-box domain-containing protein n=1 Tax=Caenorhabditis remanei TaxID=31234 RepID=E3NPB1_CAERE|nr:hypothetical protein CRE_07909 [Caenorhabditis remanei]
MAKNLVSPLRLLKLPEKVIDEVLCNLEINEAISFSLCSQKTKNLFHSLKQYKVENLKMRICTEVRIHGIFNGMDCYFVLNRNPIPQVGRSYVKDMRQSEMLYLCMNITKFEWRNLGFDVGDWIKHLLFIFNQTSLIELYIASNSVVWSLDIQGIEIYKLFFAFLVPDYNFRSIMETVRNFRAIVLRRNPFENKLDLQKVLMQNLDSIKCHRLDDVLICNSLIFCIVPNIKQKGLNGLLKLFIFGAMPRLKHLRFVYMNRFSGPLQEETVMKGITYTVQEPNVIRTFGESPASEEINIRGGLDFQRADGTQATVILLDGDAKSFDIFVWD